MLAVYGLFLAVGLCFLIAGLGNLVYFLSLMAGSKHLSWGVYFVTVILSGVLMTVGIILTLYYFPLVLNLINA